MPLFGKPTPQDEARAAAYGTWLRARDPFAIASLVLGIFSLIEFGAILLFGLAGAALGLLALRRLKNPNPPHPHGHYLALAGIATSLASLLIAIFFIYRWI